MRQFGYSMTAKRLDDRPRGWTEPSLVDADVRRDLFKVLRGIDPRHTLEAARRLRELDRPALLAWAYEDRFFKSAFAERLAGDLRNARIERIADSRTFVPIDQPARLAELIREFMHETGAGTDGPRSVATAER